MSHPPGVSEACRASFCPFLDQSYYSHHPGELVWDGGDAPHDARGAVGHATLAGPALAGEAGDDARVWI